MDLIGHLGVIEDAGLLSGDQLWGTEALIAFLPNLAHCHQWAYESLWDVHRRNDLTRARVIQSHMICDWVIHYGPKWTPVKERVGWAYQEMPAAVERLDTFMDHVVATGMVITDPREQDTREHLERDFGHTSVECALDLGLSQRYTSEARLASVCEEFRRWGNDDYRSKLLQIVFDETGGYTLEPPAVLDRTATEYARWSHVVRRPYEFAALTIISKYGMVESREAIDFVLSFLDELARGFSPSESRRCVGEIVERIADPDLCIMEKVGGPPKDTGIGEDKGLTP
jgi:hypothetical protein